jgi:hypothetical protein
MSEPVEIHVEPTPGGEPTVPADGRSVADELKAIEANALDWSERCQRESTLFSRLHYGIGIPAIVLSAVAGAVAVSKSAPLVAGICALAVTTLTGLQSFVHADRRRVSDRLLATDFRQLADDARVAREIDLVSMNADQQRGRLDDLRTRRNEIERKWDADAGQAT